MENLLRQSYTANYNLPPCMDGEFVFTTNNSHFELKDDSTVIYKNNGVSKFSNPTNKTITVINYETFVNQLSHRFRQDRNVCDLIVISDNNGHFILSELTDTHSKYINPYINTKGHQIGKRAKAQEQLLKTLIDLLAVPQIFEKIKKYSVKQCCFFNKQSMAPSPINASSAFSRLNSLYPNGFKMTNLQIEANDFEYYEFSYNQTFNMQ